jgi:hypothetical protein
VKATTVAVTLSKTRAKAGSPRAPIPRLVAVTPSCIAAMKCDGVEVSRSTARARRLPCCSSSRRRVRLAVTRPYSAATKNAFKRIRAATAKSSRAKVTIAPLAAVYEEATRRPSGICVKVYASGVQWSGSDSLGAVLSRMTGSCAHSFASRPNITQRSPFAGDRSPCLSARRHCRNPATEPNLPAAEGSDPPKGAEIGSPILKCTGDSADTASCPHKCPTKGHGGLKRRQKTGQHKKREPTRATGHHLPDCR